MWIRSGAQIKHLTQKQTQDTALMLRVGLVYIIYFGIKGSLYLGGRITTANWVEIHHIKFMGEIQFWQEDLDFFKKINK